MNPPEGTARKLAVDILDLGHKLIDGHPQARSDVTDKLERMIHAYLDQCGFREEIAKLEEARDREERNALDCQRAQQTLIDELQKPIPMLLWCPGCGSRHLDEGEFATKPHETHACQHCGMVWKPSKRPTVGVQFLPGYKNEQLAPTVHRGKVTSTHTTGDGHVTQYFTTECGQQLVLHFRTTTLGGHRGGGHGDMNGQ